jgi:hypothetical protein
MGQSFSILEKSVASVESQFQKEKIAKRVEEILSDNEIDSAL